MEVSPLFSAPIHFSYAEDLQNRGLWDWMRTYASYLEPAHKFKGQIRLYDDILEIEGAGKSEETTFVICTNHQLLPPHLGFDEVYTRLEDRFGGLLYQPLRLEIENGNQRLRLYALMGFNPLLRRTDNLEWYERLLAWREGNAQ
jgi:hypothetical protein